MSHEYDLVILGGGAAALAAITRSYSPDILMSIRVFGYKSVLNIEPRSQAELKRSRKAYALMLQCLL